MEKAYVVFLPFTPISGIFAAARQHYTLYTSYVLGTHYTLYHYTLQYSLQYVRTYYLVIKYSMDSTSTGTLSTRYSRVRMYSTLLRVP